MKQERLFHLSDAQWTQIEGAFPQRRGRSGFERKISNRLAFEAVLCRERTGCPWRDLPAAYGDDHTIYMRRQRWATKDVRFSIVRRAKHRVSKTKDLDAKGVGFRSLRESIDTTSAGGKLVFHLFGALAEFERELIRERTGAGLASARARGRLVLRQGNVCG